MYEDLNNPTNYVLIEANKTANIVEEINAKISDWADRAKDTGDISTKLQNWVVNTEARAGNIHQFYKAHKPEKGYPGRNISSVCCSPIERLSNWLEFYLAPIARECKYRIEDTNHCLLKIEELNKKGLVTDDTILVSWDIRAMFPSIDNEKGLEACRERLDARENNFPKTETTMEALQLCLENNISRFEDKIFFQDSGTAMGPAFACSYADNTVGRAIDIPVIWANWTRGSF